MNAESDLTIDVKVGQSTNQEEIFEPNIQLTHHNKIKRDLENNIFSRNKHGQRFQLPRVVGSLATAITRIKQQLRVTSKNYYANTVNHRKKTSDESLVYKTCYNLQNLNSRV